MDATSAGVIPNPPRIADGPSQSAGTCASCAAASAARMGQSAFIYAIGRVQARFPTLALEKEFAQVAGRSGTTGLTDREALHKVCSQKQHRYLVRQLCWVLAIEGLDTYILQPRDISDFDLLVNALRPSPSPADLDVVVGMRGPNAPAQVCNGMQLPIVGFDQIYSFDRQSFIDAIPKPTNADANKFAAAVAELLDRMVQLADNAGATDEHRAINYLTVRYPAIYAKAAEAFAANSSLTSVSVRPSNLSGSRKIVEVIFSYANRNTDVVEKYFVRIDVTEEFPFLISKLSSYFDR